MSEKLRIGIVGCGKAGHMHASALMTSRKALVCAAQSREQNRADSFASRYNAKGFTSIAEMVTREKLDVAVICTPHPNHLVAVEALEAGAHVLIEKPLATTLSDCDKILSAAERSGRKVGVVGQRRFYPSSVRMRKAIEAGKIGTPVLGTVTMLGWRDEAYYKSDPWRGTWAGEGGGVLVNQAPHQLDMFQWLMNDEIESLYGLWTNLNHPYIEVDDTALAIVRFKRGGVGNILVSNSQKPGLYGNVHIHGSKGASVGVQTDSGAMFIAGMSGVVAPPVNDLWNIPGEEHLLEAYRKEDEAFFATIDPIGHFIRMQNEDFIDAIVHDREPMISGKEGRKTVELFTAIYESTRTGKTVKWPAP
jgi:predicted dehydrogenase